MQAHPDTTQEERLTVCRTLNCQKLSQEACAHAVQSELMPLRMIVQAMFMQQLQTRSVLNSHLESAAQSFREHPDDVRSRSMMTPDAMPAHHSGRLRSAGSSFRDNDLYIEFPKKEILVAPRADYQATEHRLRSLEAELSRMRKALARQQSSVPESSNANSLIIEHSGSLKSTPCRMATVQESTGNLCSAGCMSQLKPTTRTSHGLLAKALQKLRNFGKTSTKSVPAAKAPPSTVRAPILEFVVGRTDSMPRPINTKPPRHSRHNSMS